MENGLHVRGWDCSRVRISRHPLQVIDIRLFRLVRALSELVLLRSSAQGGSRGDLPNSQPQMARIFGLAIIGPRTCALLQYSTYAQRDTFGVLLPFYLIDFESGLNQRQGI